MKQGNPIITTIFVLASICTIAAFWLTFVAKKPPINVSNVSVQVEQKEAERKIKTSNNAVALVFDPPSNVREYPNGPIICSVQEKGAIEIGVHNDGWYETNVCGKLGVIHKSQLSFKSESLLE